MAYQMKPSAGVPEVVVEDAAGRVFEDQGSADPGLWFGVPGREIGAAGAARLDWPFQDFGSCGLGHLQDGGLSARVGVAGGLGLGDGHAHQRPFRARPVHAAASRASPAGQAAASTHCYLSGRHGQHRWLHR